MSFDFGARRGAPDEDVENPVLDESFLGEVFSAELLFAVPEAKPLFPDAEEAPLLSPESLDTVARDPLSLFSFDSSAAELPASGPEDSAERSASALSFEFALPEASEESADPLSVFSSSPVNRLVTRLIIRWKILPSAADVSFEALLSLLSVEAELSLADSPEALPWPSEAVTASSLLSGESPSVTSAVFPSEAESSSFPG